MAAHEETSKHAAKAASRIHGHLRDGNRKEMTLYDDEVVFNWSDGGLIPLLPLPFRMELSWGHRSRYPHIRRTWIERRRLFVERKEGVHWIRFGRKDRAEAERCLRFIQERLPPPEELELDRQELEPHPERHHGRRIRVTAWVRREFEGSFLIWNPEAYLAQPLDPMERTLSFDYKLRGFDGSSITSGQRVLQMPNVAFMQTLVAIRAKREFLDVAGEQARQQAYIWPIRSRSWVERMQSKLFDWVSCLRDMPDPDERIDLRGLDGMFGPMVLHGIFETRPGGRSGFGSALLTVYHVCPLGTNDSRRSSHTP